MTQTTTALVLGAKLGTGNIGEEVYRQLEEVGWLADWHSCRKDVGDGIYDVPAECPWEDYDALVITLGREGAVPFAQSDDLLLADVVRANLLLPLQCMRTWVAARWGAGGKCVVIGSYAHDHVLTQSTAYCAAKAGLAQAVRSLAWELTSQEFYFHVVHPYHVPDTPMGLRVMQSMMENRGMDMAQAREYQRKDLQLPEHLSPADVARMVVWLLVEPTAAWLAGQGLQLYGGVR